MRRTCAAKRLPGSASMEMNAGWPTRTRATSASSIGADTYMQWSSIRSIAGGVGRRGIARGSRRLRGRLRAVELIVGQKAVAMEFARARGLALGDARLFA